MGDIVLGGLLGLLLIGLLGLVWAAFLLLLEELLDR